MIVLYTVHGVIKAYLADADLRAVSDEVVLCETSNRGPDFNARCAHLVSGVVSIAERLKLASRWWSYALFEDLWGYHVPSIGADPVDESVAALRDTRDRGDNLMYSVLVKVSGVRERNYYEIDYDDVDAALVRASLEPDHTEPNDSEYYYLVTEEYGDSAEYVESDDSALWCPSRGYIDDKRKQSHFWGIQDMTASGILTADDLETLCNNIGAYAEDCETMGTLGGPLGGIVPDISFRMDSHILIETIRVTPFNPAWTTDHVVTEEEWRALRSIVLERFGIG